MIGTAGPDNITAPRGAVVWAGDGDDTIRMDGGYACGGPGVDSIFGSSRTEHMDGGKGNDDLRGNEAAQPGDADVILSGLGADRLTDFQDADYKDIYDPGTDILRGGDGNDFIRSWAGSDKLYGDAGDEWLRDSTKKTTYLYGGQGNDQLEGWFNDLYECDPFGDAGYGTATVDTRDVVQTYTTEEWETREHVSYHCP